MGMIAEAYRFALLVAEDAEGRGSKSAARVVRVNAKACYYRALIRRYGQEPVHRHARRLRELLDRAERGVLV